MDLKQLRYFVAIVDAGSMMRAADILCIAQPALSLHVKNLEEEFGVQLFFRSVQGVKPTAAGDLLYKHAKGLLRHADNTRFVLSQQADRPSGRVSVGLPSSTAHLIAMDVLATVLADYPGIKLELIESPSAALSTLVLQGRVDLAVVVSDQPVRGLKQVPLMTEQLFVVTLPPPAPRESRMTLQELARHPLVLVSPPNVVRTLVDQSFAAARLSYELVAEVSATSLLVTAVKQGMGATVLPWSAVHEEVATGALAVTSLADGTWARPLVLCHSEAMPLSPAAEIVHQLIVREVARRVSQHEWVGAAPTGAASVAAPAAARAPAGA